MLAHPEINASLSVEGDRRGGGRENKPFPRETAQRESERDLNQSLYPTSMMNVQESASGEAAREVGSLQSCTAHEGAESDP